VVISPLVSLMNDQVYLALPVLPAVMQLFLFCFSPLLRLSGETSGE